MTGFDCNCYVGGWPFHKVRHNTFAALRKLHEDNDIGSGFVSSTEAIFFNDPFEAEEELHKVLEGSPYQHVMTVNPTLPGFVRAIQRGVEDFEIAGIRVFPGFHSYSLMGQEMRHLVTLLENYDLPLFINLRMEDERTTYLFHPKAVGLSELMGFFREYPKQTVIVCDVLAGEAKWMHRMVLARDDIFLECSGMRDGLFNIDELHAVGLTERLVYGSSAPIFCMKSSKLLIETADLPAETKTEILTAAKLRKKLQR